MGEIKPGDEKSGLVARSWERQHRKDKAGVLTEETLEGKQVTATWQDRHGHVQQAEGEVIRTGRGHLAIKSKAGGVPRRYPRCQRGRDKPLTLVQAITRWPRLACRRRLKPAQLPSGEWPRQRRRPLPLLPLAIAAGGKAAFPASSPSMPIRPSPPATPEPAEVKQRACQHQPRTRPDAAAEHNYPSGHIRHAGYMVNKAVDPCHQQHHMGNVHRD